MKRYYLTKRYQLGEKTDEVTHVHLEMHSTNTNPEEDKAAEEGEYFYK